MTDKCKERKSELRGEVERIYFYLTIRAECSKLRGADMGDGDVIQVGVRDMKYFLRR